MNLPNRMTRTPPSLGLRIRFAVCYIAGAAALSIGLAPPAAAGLVLRIGPETTTVTRPTTGNTTNVTLTAYVRADANTESVANYTVPIDLTPPGGPGIPSGMLLIREATIRTLFPERTFYSDVLNDPNGEADFYASVIGPFVSPRPPPVVFGTDFSPLFDFTISIDDTVAVGDYAVDVVRDSVLLAFDPDLSDNIQFEAPAVIRVVAVPEPSVLGLLGLLAVPYVLWRQTPRGV